MADQDDTAHPLAEEIPASEDEQSDPAADPTKTGEEKKKKKKKNKKNKGKRAAVSADGVPADSPGPAYGHKIPSGMVQQILKGNPSLAGETQGTDPKKIQEMLGQLTLEEMLTGMVRSGSL